MKNASRLPGNEYGRKQTDKRFGSRRGFRPVSLPSFPLPLYYSVSRPFCQEERCHRAAGKKERRHRNPPLPRHTPQIPLRPHLFPPRYCFLQKSWYNISIEICGSGQCVRVRAQTPGEESGSPRGRIRECRSWAESRLPSRNRISLPARMDPEGSSAGGRGETADHGCGSSVRGGALCPSPAGIL